MAKKKIILTLGILGTVFFTLLFSQYFQQDEWHSFGLIQSYGLRYITLDKSVWELVFSDRVGARVIMYILFSFFGASALPFAIFSSIIHTINSFLVFLLAKHLTKNNIISFIASIFFFFNSLGHQAYSWFGTVAGSTTAVVFVLLSVIFYFKFLEKKSTKNLLLSILFIWVSFLFKESGAFVFLLYPVIWFLYEEKKNIKIFILKNWPIVLYGLATFFLLARSVVFISGERANYISASTSGALKLLNHLLVYPFEGIGQSFIPFQPVFEIGKIATKVFVPSLTPNTPEFDLFYTTKMTEGVILVLSFLVVVGLFFVYKKFLTKESKSIRYFSIFSLLFLVLSFLPYVVLDKFDAYLDSRYYYMGLVGSSYIFSIFVVYTFKNIRSSLGKRIFIGIAFLIILSHVFFLFTDLYSLARVSSERRSIVKQILAFYPSLENKTVFYITGNSPGYYGISELKVPFQSGLGQVLMVVYGEKGKVDPTLFKENTLGRSLDAGFLYDTLAQGYKEVNGKGFGYYYDLEMIEKELEEENFIRKDVISLFYDSDTKKIKKIKFD